MTNAQQNFIACIQGLEKFNLEYIQANREILETRSPIQIQPTSSVISSGLITTSSVQSIVINDYVRMCRMYCIMLWTYWETLGIQTQSLDEIRLVRNCLVHYEGDMARYSQSRDAKWAAQGKKLISISQGKPYIQVYNLIIKDQDLTYFTMLVKTEFTNSTGVTF